MRYVTPLNTASFNSVTLVLLDWVAVGVIPALVSSAVFFLHCRYFALQGLLGRGVLHPYLLCLSKPYSPK